MTHCFGYLRLLDKNRNVQGRINVIENVQNMVVIQVVECLVYSNNIRNPDTHDMVIHSQQMTCPRLAMLFGACLPTLPPPLALA
jgi:hypothetical protein